MKNFGKSKKNFKAASAASKTFAWVLSIMLVVTGIAPSFAENGKVGNAGVAKKAAASEQAGMKKTYANKATAVSKENTQKNNNNSVNIKAKEQKKKKSDKKATASKEKSSNNKGKKFAFKKKVYKDEGKDDDEAAPRQSRLSKKKAAELKKDVAYDVNMMIQNGYSSYYKNSDNSSKTPKIQNTNLNYLLKTRAVKNIASSMKFLNLKKTQNTPKDQNGKKNKFKNKREGDKVTRLNTSGNVIATIRKDKTGVAEISAVNTAGDMRIERARWGNLVRSIGGNAAYQPGSDVEINWGKAMHLDFVTKGIRLPEDSSSFFYGLGGYVYHAENIDTSDVRDMRRMFSNTQVLAKGVTNLSRWNTRKVLDMSYMFDNCSTSSSGVEFPDISRWKTSNVTNMESMFAETSRSNFSNFDISKWDVSNVTNMSRMFMFSRVRRLDLSKWELNRRVENINELGDVDKPYFFKPIGGIFCGTNLEWIKTPRGLLAYIHMNGYSFASLVKKGQEVVPAASETKGGNNYIKAGKRKEDNKYQLNSYTFVANSKYCAVNFNKNGGDVEAWMNCEIVEKGKSFNDSKGVLPQEEPKKNGHQFAGWAYSPNDKAPTFNKDQKINENLTLYAVYLEDKEYPLNDSGNVFAKPKVGANGETTLEINVKDGAKDTLIDGKWIDMATAFGASGSSSADLSWTAAGDKVNIKFLANVRAPSDMTQMFYSFKGNIVGLDHLDTEGTSNFKNAFANVTGRVDGNDFINWNVKSGTGFEGMFKNSSIDPNVGNWDTQNAQDMRSMFEGATSANPDVSKWNVKNVKKIDSMFNAAGKANPDISKWNFGNLESMREAFYESRLEKADLSKWKFTGAGLSNAADAFVNCDNLVYLKTPMGLTTTMGGANSDFKVVRLEKGSPAAVEEETLNLGSDYTVNAGGRENVAFNIYRKDAYVGVIFDVNSGDRESFRNHEIAKIGKSIRASGGVLPEEKPQKNASTFKGWSKDKNTQGDGEFNENEAITEDVTVYAIYEQRVPAKVRFHATGGNLNGVPSEVDGLTGTSLGNEFPTEQPNRKGYDFIGWSTKPEDANTGLITPGREFTRDTLVPNVETEVYAVWKERSKITIKFNGNGGNLGSIPESREIYEREALGADFPVHTPSNVSNMDPKREGYTFIGWGYNKHARAPEATKDTVFTKSETLYAIWKEGDSSTIGVKFDANGGSYKGADPSVILERGTALGARFPSEIPERSGKTFFGYADKASASEPNITAETVFDDSAVAYAVWKDEGSAYKVEFDVMGGVPDMQPVYVEAGKKLGDRFPKTLPRKAGKMLVGFTSNRAEAELGIVTDANKVDKDTEINKDTVAYAAFKKKEVSTVTFDANGGNLGSVPAKVDTTYNTNLGNKFPAAQPKKDNYEFKGWTMSKAEADKGIVTDENKVDKDTVITDDITAYAAWSKKEHEVHFISDNKEVEEPFKSPIKCLHGEALKDKFPTGHPAKPDYTFIGWSTSKTEAENGVLTPAHKFDKDTKITGETTVYAVWKELAEVSFNANGGDASSVPDPIKVVRGEKLGDNYPTKIPTRAGHKFLGWSDDPNAYSPNITRDSVIQYRTTLFAIWQEMHTVTFNANGGEENSVPSPIYLQDGEKIGANMPGQRPIRRGYTFKGWASEPNAKTANITEETVVISNMTAYAIWKPVTCAVTFVNGIKKYAVKYANYDTTLGNNMPEAPDKMGYTFAGWSMRANDPNLEYEFTKYTRITGRMKVFAIFKRATHKQITRITLNLSKSMIRVGEMAEVIAEIEPTDVLNKELLWKSSNNNGLEIRNAGNSRTYVKAHKRGIYTITAKAKDGSGTEGRLRVKVEGKQPGVPTTDANVMFNAGSAAGFPKIVNIKKGETLLGKMPKNPKIYGLKFLGWSTKILGKKTDINFTEDTVVKNDMSVYAVYEEDTTVNVEPKIQKITLESNKNEIKVGEETDVIAKVEPNSAKLKDLEYYVDAGLTVVSIDGNKLRVRGNTVGRHKIKASARDGSNKKAELEINVKEKTQGKAYVWLMAEGVLGYPDLLEVDEGTALGDLLPMGLSKPGMEFHGWSTMGYAGDPDFTSSDIVNTDMTLYAVFKSVVPVPPEKQVKSIDLKLSKSTIYDGDEVDVIADVEPSSAENKTLEWSISPSNAKIIDINERAIKVHNLREGSYTVTAKSTDGSNIEKTIEIDVLKKGAPPSNKATVRFMAPGAADYPKAVEVMKGSSVGFDMPDDPDIVGFNFRGWSTKMNPVNASDVNFTKDTKVDKDMSVYAVFERDPGIQAENKIEKIVLKAAKREVEVGSGINILAAITPPDADIKHLTFESENADKFPVEQMTDTTARAYAKEAGTFKITARANDGSGKYGEITIKVVPKNPVPTMHTVTMMSDAVGYPKTVVVEDGKAIGDKLDMDLTKPNAVFKGWSRNTAAGPVDFTRDTLVYANTIVYAVFDYQNPKMVESIDLQLSRTNINAGDYVDALALVNPVDASNKDIRFTVTPGLNVEKTSLTTARIYAAREGRYTLRAESTDGSNVFKQVVFEVNDSGTGPIPSTHAKVVFNADGDNNFPRVLTVKKGEALGGRMPADPVRQGFRFKEWRIVGGAGATLTKDTRIDQDTEVYARYIKEGLINKKIKNITLLAGSTLLELNDQTAIGALIDPEDADYKDLTFTSLNPSVLKVDKTGEIAARATAKKRGSAVVRAEANDGSGVSGEITINVEPKKESVKLTMEAQGIAGFPKTVDVTKGESYADLPMDLVKPGHVFMGWSTISSTGSVDFNKHTKVMTDSKIYAVFKKDIVHVTVRADGVDGYPITVPVQRGSALLNLLPKKVEKDGFKFKGYSTISPTGAVNFTEDTVVNEDTVVYAVFEATQAASTKIKNITLAVTKSSIEKGDTFDVIASIEPDNATNKVLEFTSSNNDKLKITGIKDRMISLKALDKGKYSVRAKATDGSGVEAETSIEVKEKDINVPRKAKVTLYADDVAGYPQVIEVMRGDTLADKLPARIERAGYDFLGYSKEKNGPINFFSDTAVKEDMNVYAVYRKQGSILKKVNSIKLAAGSLRMQLGDITDVLAIVSPTDATDKRVRFTLDRADILKIVNADDSAARVEAVGEGVVKVKAEALDGSGVTNELAMEVIRKPAKKVKVTLNAEGITGYPKVVEAEEGTSLDAGLPMDLKKPGYVFRGWSYEKDGEVNFTKHTQVSRDTEVHAIFKKDEVSVLFIADRAAGFPKSVAVERGKAILDNMPANPVRDGYTFKGWSTESSLGALNLTRDNVIDKDTIVYAVFDKQGAIAKPISEITLGVTKSDIREGDEADVIASISPSDADDKRLKWESSAPDKLKIEQTSDNFARIKAVTPGTYTVTAKAKDGSNKQASIEIKVLSKGSGSVSNKVKVMVSADGVAGYPKLIEINKGATLKDKLPANIQKTGCEFKGYTKVMGNPADFDENEAITEDLRLYAVFEQKTAPSVKVQSIELNKSKSIVRVGDAVDIIPTITPKNADNKSLDYVVDKKGLALIHKNPDGTLRLYAESKGKVVVTAKATDGSDVTKSIEIEIGEMQKARVDITLNADGVAGYPKQLTVDKGEALGNALPNVLDRTDYDFRGWSTSPNGMIDVNRLTQMTSSIPIYAVFTKKQVNVRMLAEGVNGYPKNMSFDIHSTLGANLPTNIDRDGYEFKGWSKDSFTGDVNITSSSQIDESITIYAVFERKAPVTHKVTKISLEDLSTEKKVTDKEFGLLANILPENADDKTLEWSANDPSVKIVQRQNNLVRVVATKAGNYSITAKAKDGSGVEDTYSFTVEKAVPETKVVTLEATDTAGYPKVLRVNKGEALVGRLPMGLEREGYTFLGWSNVQGSPVADYDVSLPVVDDLTLYAVFKKDIKPAKFVEKVELSGKEDLKVGESAYITASVMPMYADNKELKFESSDSDKLTVKRAGKNEVLVVANKKGTAYVKATAMDGSGVTAEHKITITAEMRKITFRSGEGTGNMPMQEVEQGSEFRLPLNGFTAPKDKEFDAWEVQMGTNTPARFMPGNTVPVYEDIVVTAKWKDVEVDPNKKVTARFEKGDPDASGSMPDVTGIVRGSDYILPENDFTAPAGLMFDKWKVEVGTNPVQFKSPGEKVKALDDMTVTATWRNAEKRKVTFKDKDESLIETKEIEHGKAFGTSMPAYTKPLDPGYAFLGWSKSAEDAKRGTITPGNEFTKDTLVKEDTTVYAVVGKNVSMYKVTLDGNGGVLAGGATAVFDVAAGNTVKAQLEAAVANEIFTKPGYKFVGFSKSRFAALPDYNLDSPVYYNTTLYAVYEEAHEVTKVTIKYTEVGMQEDEVIENVPLGKAIGSKLDGHEKHRDGYRFLGYSKVNGAVKPDFFKKSIVTRDMVIYPVYKKNANDDEVVVSFNANGGEKAPKAERIPMYDSLGAKMPGKENAPVRDGYLFTGWARSKAAKYPDFFRGTTVKGNITVYAVWKSLYDEKLGQTALKVSAKAKGYELTIEPPKADLHTGFEIFRSEDKDFKPSKDNKIATINRNTLKYLDDKADNSKVYYYAVRAIDADGSYNGTKVTFIGKLSEAVLAAPLPKDKSVTATVAGKGAVNLEFNKTVAAAKYKVIVTAPYDKKFKERVKEIEANKLMQAAAGKVKANITGLPMGKFLAFKLEALEADNTKLVEYGNSFAFMMGAVEKLTAKVNKKRRVLNIKFKAMKGASGYEAKIVINGKVKTIKLKKGKKKFKNFMVGSIKLPKKKGKYTFTIRAFKKIGKLKYYGRTITKTFR